MRQDFSYFRRHHWKTQLKSIVIVAQHERMLYFLERLDHHTLALTQQIYTFRIATAPLFL